MTDLDKEFDAIKAQSLGLKWLKKPCVAVCEVLDFMNSDNIEDYKGKPYFEFMSQTDQVDPESKEPIHMKIRFGRAYEGLSEKAVEIRQQQLKEFLTNAGADFTKSGIEILHSVKGNSIKCLFRTREYVGYDDDRNQMPIIKEILEYSFSTGPTQSIEGNESYFHKSLRDKDRDKLAAELADWKRDNPEVSVESIPTPTPEAEPTPEAPSDLPWDN